MRIQQREDVMSDLYQSLSHSKWDCKYHVVFVPKRRRPAAPLAGPTHWGDLLTPPKHRETKWQRCPYRLIAIAHAIVCPRIASVAGSTVACFLSDCPTALPALPRPSSAGLTCRSFRRK